MSYMIDKFESGDVKIRGAVYGWEFDNSDFRPLQDDAMKELYEAGYADICNVTETHKAHLIYQENWLTNYIDFEMHKSPEQKREEAIEMRAAFGPGETIVNIITGERIST